MKLHHRALVGLAGLLALHGLVACREEAATTPPSALLAPAAPPDRFGEWLGGPEPVSGKLRSGIVSWWRLTPAHPTADEPFELALRLEGARADDAAVSVATGDGARLADPAPPQRWLLQPGQPAQITLRLAAPGGDSYLHVTTVQEGRSSVRSIRLTVPAGSTSAAGSAPDRGDYTRDALGEPIVRMRSGK